MLGLGRTKLLLVAYTNHALDQILEAIIAAGFDRQLVLRLGRRCTSREIEQIALHERVKQLRDNGMKPTLSQEERRRNAMLQSTMEGLRHKIRGHANFLARIVWDVPELVPLPVLQNVLVSLLVRSHGLLVTRASMS